METNPRQQRGSADMIDNPFYGPVFPGDYELVSIGGLDLEEGCTMADCQLAVVTWGDLNEARDNAILITTWYSQTYQIWRDIYLSAFKLLPRRRRSYA
jgi:homoserine O-acetyltransferase